MTMRRVTSAVCRFVLLPLMIIGCQLGIELQPEYVP